MEATFKLDPCHTLTIRSGHPANSTGSAKGVTIGLKYEPLACNEPSPVGGTYWWAPFEREMFFASADARAIGSAIIGAAVSARE